MPLTPGTRLGPYEVVSTIGAGGMGEVYRATDTKLGRPVAIKVLPAQYAADADRLHRFEQEARTTGLLNHPNILTVHDVGHAEGHPYLVSELLEGESLRERLQRGPLGADRAVELITQAARGLAAAHGNGVVHRDLKPDNIFITRDGRVKILDFGIAKLVQPEGQGLDQFTTVPGTAVGAVVGTVAYMSPEQVAGRVIDQRSDLFSVGVVLYEMLTGRRPFAGDSPIETMTAVLHEEPAPLSSSNRNVPPALARIVTRCLEKGTDERFQSASDLAFALQGLSDTPSVSGVASARRPLLQRAWIGWAVAALLLAGLAPLAFWRAGEPAPAPGSIRFQVPPTVEFAGPGNFSVSPDGRHLAFTGRGSDGIARLWIRTMDSLEVRPLPGSEVNESAPPPFWSPDGRFLAFDAGGRLKKLDLLGGLPQTLCDLPRGSVAVGGSWNRDGDIIFGNFGGLLRVRDSGGDASPLTALDASRKEEFHLLPTFLPDGRHFVYLRVSPAAPETSGVYIGTLDAKPEAQSLQRLMPYAPGVTYAPATNSGVGRLFFLREGTLIAQPFDERRLALAGEPVPVAERVGSFRDGAYFSVSNNDVLVYRAADTDSQLTWFDRQGVVAGRASEPGGFRDVALSPDGTRAVASRTNPLDTTKADLWLFDLKRGGGATRLTLGGGLAGLPVWSPDGTRIAFTFNNSVLRQKLASGEGDEEELLRSSSASSLWANSWSPDGRFLVYAGYDVSASGPGNLNLGVLPVHERKPVPFIRDTGGFNEEQARFSPMGRWVAYVSNQSGVQEVYVREFAVDFNRGSATTGESVLVSRGGGNSPRWRGDGRELFYLAPDGKLMAVDVTAGPRFQSGTPAALFQTPPGTLGVDVAADGKRFLLVTSASVPFTVVLNWTSSLKN